MVPFAPTTVQNYITTAGTQDSETHNRRKRVRCIGVIWMRTVAPLASENTTYPNPLRQSFSRSYGNLTSATSPYSPKAVISASLRSSSGHDVSNPLINTVLPSLCWDPSLSLPPNDSRLAAHETPLNVHVHVKCKLVLLLCFFHKA